MSTQLDDLAIGIDFGGTKIFGVVMDRRGQVLVRSRIPSPKEAGALVDAIVGLANSLEAQVDQKAIGVGIGAAGMVGRNGVLHYGPNVGGISYLDLLKEIGARLGPDYKVRVDNDANVATWGECLFGAGRRAREMVMVTVGTGVGGGVISSGRLHRGANGFSAEFGHMTIVPEGLTCACGRLGCFEVYASGNALGRMARDAAAAGRFDAGIALAGSADMIIGEHVSEAADRGDADAKAIFSDFAHWLGIGISSLVSLFDPEIIVIGGGLSGNVNHFIDETCAYVDANNFGAAQRPKVEIKAAELGQTAGVIGAGMLIFGDVIPEI